MAGSGPFSSFGVAGQRAGHERFIGVYLRPNHNVSTIKSTRSPTTYASHPEEIIRIQSII